MVPSIDSSGSDLHSAICFIIDCRTVSRNAETSCTEREDVSTGERTLRKISEGSPNFQLFFGIQLKDPSITKGSIGTPVLIASMKAPSVN